MNAMLERYRSTITDNPTLSPDDPRLLIERSGELAMHYAPFEFVQVNARVVLVGITPGAFQAQVALGVLREALNEGMPDIAALQRAKSSASFSGTLRKNLVSMLDSIGLHRTLGVSSCIDVFADGSELVHFTSALRYPVFVDGENYSGSPAIASSGFLRPLSARWLREEASALPDAVWIPLGKEPAAAMERLVSEGLLRSNQVLDGLPHPSGANAERISYFLGLKHRDSLSGKTNPAILDAAKLRLMQKIKQPEPTQPPSPIATSTVAVASTKVQPKIRDDVPQTTKTRESDRAEKALSSAFKRVKSSTDKIAGFETGLGRHLAIQRNSAGLRVWTEETEFPEGLGTFKPYSANTRRHSNLAANAPRCSYGRRARLWTIEGLDNLDRLIAWYATA